MRSLEFPGVHHAGSLAIVESVRVCGIEVDYARNSVRMAICNRTQLRPSDRVPSENGPFQIESVNHRRYVVSETTRPNCARRGPKSTRFGSSG